MKKECLLILSILTIFLIGCGANSDEIELENPDKSPESLNDLSSGIDDIGQSLDEIERLIMDLPISEEEEEEEEKRSEMPGTQGQVQGSEEEEKQGQDEGSQGEENQANESSKEEPQDSSLGQSQGASKSKEEIKNQKTESVWQDIEKTVEETHGYWNEYQVEGQKKGASREQLDSFEASLNRLTISIERNNLNQGYGEMSQCYLSLSPFLDLYEDDIMAELTNLKYNTYRSYSMGIGNEVEIDFQIFDNNDEIYSRIKPKVDDQSKDDLIDRLENSLASLKKGLSEDSSRVKMIKKNIVLENIKELEE